MTSRRFHSCCATLALSLIAATAVRGASEQTAAARRLAAYEAATPNDAIARLQRHMDAGDVTLAFDEKWGYLPAVLKALKIPASSQSLVFSKTSFQLNRIGPWNPRAIYFNDETYVGWVQRGTMLEFATVDPNYGAMFYTLNQQAAAKPQFERQTHNCLQCHDSTLNTGGVPGFVVQSLYVDRYGYPLADRRNPVMSDRTPFRERFGGWYVTGTHGDQVHMGNLAATQSAGDIGNAAVYIQRADLHAGANVTDITKRMNAPAYWAHGSDIVALTLLVHQTSLHNLITQASLDAGGPNETASAEAMVRGLFFAGEAPLSAPIRGTSTFADEFAAAGPRDPKGRSLRDLDLSTRVLKYPLSYLIYSDGFDGLPASVTRYVSRRIDEILADQDTSGAFTALDAPTRQAIREILTSTKPGLLPAASSPSTGPPS